MITETISTIISIIIYTIIIVLMIIVSIRNRRLKKQNWALEESNDSLLDKNSDLDSSLISTRKKVNDLALNFSTRRIIAGANGSGKTHFIQNIIIPQLSNYFVIDPHGEYISVPNSKKLVVDGSKSKTEIKKAILAAVKKNKDKILILDSVETWLDYAGLISIMRNHQFITTAQSSYLIIHTIDIHDFVLDIGLNDARFVSNNTKVVNYPYKLASALKSAKSKQKRKQAEITKGTGVALLYGFFGFLLAAALMRNNND